MKNPFRRKQDVTTAEFGPLKDLENYYDISIYPMDHEGQPTSGRCRSLYLHKKYFDRLAVLIDELHGEQCLTPRDKR